MLTPASARVVWERMRPGLEGLDRTVDLIVRAIREGGRDELVRDRALRIVNRVPSFDHAGETQAIWDYFTGINGMRYRLDPVDVELVQGGPRIPLGGDCDCFTAQIGMTLEALGHPVAVVPVGRWAPRRAGEVPRFHHVYLEDLLTGHRAEVNTDGKGTVIDPVLHQPVKGRFARPGDQMAHELEMRRTVTMPAGGNSSMLSPDDPKRIVAEARARRALIAPQFRNATTDYGIDYEAQGAQGLSGFFEDLVNGARSLVAKFDPTNPKSEFGGVVRGAIATAANTVLPGSGGAALQALDTAASVRSSLAKAGVDPSKINADTAKVVDNALEAGAKVGIDTSGSTVKLSITKPPVPLLPEPSKENKGSSRTGLYVGAGLATLAAAGITTVVVVSKRKRTNKRKREE